MFLFLFIGLQFHGVRYYREHIKNIVRLVFSNENYSLKIHTKNIDCTITKKNKMNLCLEILSTDELCCDVSSPVRPEVTLRKQAHAIYSNISRL